MKYAVITGASSGLGEEFVKQLHTKYNCILVARREDKLIELCDQYDNCSYLAADITQSKSIDILFNFLKDKDVELFINNAGFGDCGYILETDLDKEINMIHTNVEALHICTKKALEIMKEGHILNVGSVAGLMPAGPYMATYYATKNYVVSFSRAIAYELKEHHSKIHVSVLCPGPVDTEFNQVANVKFALNGIQPKECVSYALKKMYENQVTIIPTLEIKLAALSTKVIPAIIAVGIIAHQQKKKIYK